MASRKKPEAAAEEVDLPAFDPLPVTDDEGIQTIQERALLAPDEAVRFHAGVLREAVIAAQSAGFVVSLPFDIAALDRIAISATAKVL